MINYIYRNLKLNHEDGDKGLVRQYDIFLMPWTTNQLHKYACSLERIQNLFHSALKAVNMRIPANSESSIGLKTEIRMHSLPLFLNLIILEVANKVIYII